MTKEGKKKKEIKKTKQRKQKREELRKKRVVKRKLEETFSPDRSSASQGSSDSEHSVVLFPSGESSPGSASDEGNVEKSPVAKQVERSAIAKAVETQPILARFIDHLTSVEGGRRGSKPAKEAQWRVGRLLYEVDESVTNINLLWNDEAMVYIRRAFIEGNHRLPKPRRVGTLRAYPSLLMFYDFLLTRASSLINEFDLPQEDFALIKEFQGRVQNWMKSFTEESATRKTEVHQKDYQELLTDSQMGNLFNSPMHDEFMKRFEELNGDPGTEFVELRDYLITMLLLQSAQRPGAVCNLTVDEFDAGQWDESTGVKQYVTLTKRHKTAGMFTKILLYYNLLSLRILSLVLTDSK